MARCYPSTADRGRRNRPVLECVVNVSEGRDERVLADLADAAGGPLLDLHRDGDHHRAVLTLGGDAAAVEAAARNVATAAVAAIDLGRHRGAHPRLGAVDVVPFVALEAPPGDGRLQPGPLEVAVAARDRFVRWAAEELALPCFVYGPERSLPEVRRQAWKGLSPAAGPTQPHPTAGACAVGARGALVAYNLWLAENDLACARRLATALRDPTSDVWPEPLGRKGTGGGSGVRALAFALARGLQVSCNLIDPWRVGPEVVFDAVAHRTPVARAELVGLVPGAVLDRVPAPRWTTLGLDEAATIESRLARSADTQRTEARRRATGLDGEVSS